MRTIAMYVLLSVSSFSAVSFAAKTIKLESDRHGSAARLETELTQLGLSQDKLGGLMSVTKARSVGCKKDLNEPVICTFRKSAISKTSVMNQDASRNVYGILASAGVPVTSDGSLEVSEIRCVRSVLELNNYSCTIAF